MDALDLQQIVLASIGQIVPLLVAIGIGIKYLAARSDKQREEERTEVLQARQSFYADILAEAKRMRELYEAELDRAVTLRTALAEYAQRELHLQQEIVKLTVKIEELQAEVAELRQQLCERGIALPVVAGEAKA